MSSKFNDPDGGKKPPKTKAEIAKIRNLLSKPQSSFSIHLEREKDRVKSRLRQKLQDSKSSRLEPQVRSATDGPGSSRSTVPFIRSDVDTFGFISPQVGIELNVDGRFAQSINGVSNSLKDMGVKVAADPEIIASMENLTASMQDMKMSMGVTPDLKRTIEKVLVLMEKLSTRAYNVEHNVVFGPVFGGIFDSFSSYFTTPVIAALLAALAIAYYTGYINNGIVLGAFIGYCASRFNISNLFSVASMFSDVNLVVPQSMNVEEVSTMVIGVLNSVLGVGAVTDFFDVKPIYNYIHSASKTSTGVKPIIDAFVMLFSYIKFSIGKYVWKDPNAIFRTGYSFIDTYLSEFEAIRFEYEEKRLVNSDHSLDRVRAAIADGERIALRLPGGREAMQFKFRINETLSKLEVIKKSLLATNFKFNGVRQEPVAILLRGPPGCGKSLTMQHLAHAIAARTFSSEDLAKYKTQPSLFVYNRQAENVYWEGYDSMKKITFIDDILQARDVIGVPDNEVMNVIRAVNVFENQLHCATIDLKGNTTFRSEFVIANSNVKNYNFESINDKGAFMRRWDIVVDVCPTSEFCIDPSVAIWDRVLDLAQLPIRDVDGLGTPYMDPEALEFHWQKLEKGDFVASGVTGSFDDLVNSIIGRYQTKSRWHKVYKETLNETLKRHETIVPQVGSVPAVIQMDELDFESIIDTLPPYIEEARLNEPSAYVHLVNEWVWFCTQICSEYKLVFADDYRDLFGLEMSRVKFSQLTRPRELREYTLGALSKIINAVPPLGSPLLSEDSSSSVDFNGVYESTWLKDARLLLKGIISRLPLPDKAWTMLSNMYESIRRYFPIDKCVAAFDSVLAQELVVISGIIMTLVWGIRTASKKVMKCFRGQPVSPDPLELFLEAEAPTLLAKYRRMNESQSHERSGKTVRARTPNVSVQVDEEVQSNEKKDKMGRAKAARTPLPVSVSAPVESQSLSKFNSNLVDVMRSISRKNVYEFWAPTGREAGNTVLSRFGFLIALRGRTTIFPYHFVSELGHSLLVEKSVMMDDPIEMRRTEAGGQTYCITVGDFFNLWKPLKEFEKHEIGVIRLPRGFPPAKDISSFFITEKKLEIFQKVDAALFSPFIDPKDHNTLVVQAEVVKNVVVDSKSFEAFNISRTYTYRAPTTAGDCGSLLFSDDRHGAAILGFHVAGVPSSRTGFSTIITQELVNSIFETVEEDYVFLDQHDLVVSPAPSTNTKVCLGQVEAQLAVSASGRSKIMRSILWGKWKKPLTKPARLSPFIKDGERIDPMADVVEKYNQPHIAVPLWIIEEAAHSLEDYLWHKGSNWVSTRVFTFEEAILGDGSEFFKALPRDTSAGWPYVCQGGPTSKQRFFGDGEVYDLSTPECAALKVDVELIISNAKLGVRCLHLYVDFLKDERRPVAKWETGSTRLISGGSTSLSIPFRMYFGSFQKWIMANSIDNGCAIVINEYSTAWDKMARQILLYGDNVGAGDFKSFDAYQRPDVHYAILDMINRWYGDEEGNKVRTILWYEIVNSLHLNGSVIYEWVSSLASGGPITILVNCLYDQMQFRMCWIVVFGNCSFFNDWVVLKVQGDDNVHSCALTITDRWNERVIQDNMALFGMQYGPEDKTKDVCDARMRSLEDVTFLKRSFVWDARLRRWVAPLSLDSVLEIPFWVREGASSTADVENNLKICFEELSLHSEEVFEFWKKRIVKAVYDVRSISLPANTDYFSLRREVLSRDKGGAYPTTQVPTNTPIWLRSSNNEIFDEKLEYTLLGGGSLRFYDYCQGGMKAALSIPRSRNEFGGLVEPQANKPTAVTNQNTDAELFPVALGDGGLFEPSSSSQPVTPFVVSSTTNENTDGVAQTSTVVHHVPIAPEHLIAPDTGVTQEVRVFLAKPYLLQQGTFATTDAVNSAVYTLADIYQVVTTGNPVWYNKLAGNYATRGTLVFSLFVNGNRFQQGRYIMAWVPHGGSGFNRAKYVAGHSANLCQMTQLPHVEIDVNLDSQAVLKVPFINAIGWSPLVTSVPALWDIGYLLIRTYSPLVVPSGSNTASWSLYVHMEDVQFKMPVIPQSGRGGVTATRIARTPVVEKEQKTSGPVSNFLNKVSKAADILTGVPLLSSIAAPVSWAAQIGASVASVFGWSKPRIMLDSTMVSRYVFPRYNNSDTKDTSVKLSVVDTNRVEEMTGFAGSDLDELSLNYVGSIPAWFQTTSWSTSDNAATTLTTISLSPRAFVNVKTYTANTVTFPTPIAWVSNFFSHYRGSIKLTVKIAKTEFHSGRLALSFQPYDYNALGSAPGVPTLSNTEYLHREIIDIRLGNSFTFTFPFASLHPYRPIFGNDAPYGVVSVKVLNPLIAPSSVSSSVSLLFEASAAEDFEWSYPRSLQEVPVYCITPQSGKLVNEIASSEVGFSSFMDCLAPARVCMGERVMSFRQLIKRFNPLILSFPGSVDAYFKALPYTIFVNVITASGMGGDLLHASECIPDVYSHIACCYALMRGGVSYKILDSAESDNKQMNIRNLPQSLASTSIATSNFAYAASSPAVMGGFGNGDNNSLTYSGITAGLEVEFPYYSRSYSYATADAHNNAGVDLGYIMLSTAPRTVMDLSWSSNPTATTFFRAGAEDVALGLFVSTPGFTSWNNQVS